MIALKNIMLITGLVLIFSGCSTKELNEGVESITDDVSKLFEVRE